MTEKRINAKSPRVKVMVEQRHIDDAILRSSTSCMIAEALKEVLPGMKSWSVDTQTIRFTDPEKNRRYIYITPMPCTVALVKFDQGLTIEPFKFELRHAMIHQSSALRNKAAAKDRLPRKATLVANPKDRSGVPVRVGGRATPLGALSNVKRTGVTRRKYGIRSLEL